MIDYSGQVRPKATRGRWYRQPVEAPTTPDGLPDLRLGEKVLLRRMVAGAAIQDAAEHMDISRAQAYGWLRHARGRFGVETTPELMKIVTERGLLEDGS